MRFPVSLAPFLLVATLSVPAHAAAPPEQPPAVERLATPELIQRAADRGEIRRARKLLFLARAVRAPDRLPEPYRSDVPWDGTLPLLEVRRGVSSLTDGPERREIEELMGSAAPTECNGDGGNLPDSGSSTHFFVEYKASTLAAPLTINSYLESLEASWATEVTQFGWAAPPALGSNPPPGGRYHVRIENLGTGLYGFVSSSGTHAGFVGNNPATAWNDTDAYASCMVLNQDYGPFPGTPQQALDATTAHEFHHSIQFGYGALAGVVPDDVFIEGGATWVEDLVFDSSNDSYNYLWPNFADSMGQYGASPYPYWVVFRALTERFGASAEQVMQDFWEDHSRNPNGGVTRHSLTAMQQALANRGATLAQSFHDAAIALKFNLACSAAVAYPYCLEEGPAYVAARGATPVHATIGAVPGSSSANVEDNYTTRWVALPFGAAAYDVTVANGSSDSAARIRATVACRTATGGLLLHELGQIGPLASETVLSFQPTDCAATPVAIVTNETQTGANPSTSTTKQVTVSVAAPGPTTATLSVARSGTGEGTVVSDVAGISCGSDCTEDYPINSVVTLTATPDGSSTFAGWSGDCSGTGTCQVTLDQASSVTATFVHQVELSVVTLGAGAGSVTGSGISCPADCAESYPAGTVVSLTATPSAGSTFLGWGGACSGTGGCTVTMSSASTVTARFEQPFALTVSVSGSGTVTSAPPGISCGADCTEQYMSGTVVTLTATPAPGSSFLGWGGACSGTGECAVEIHQARSVTASFVAAVDLTVVRVGAGAGSVTGPGIACPSDCTESYPQGTSVALTATPSSGSSFVGWGGACSGTGGCTVTMSSASTVTARFEPSFLLTVSVSGSGAVSSAPGGIACGADCIDQFVSGTTVTLTATPGTGATFLGWGGACSGAGSCAVQMDQARQVTAAFTSPDLTAPPPPGVARPDASFQSSRSFVVSWGTSEPATYDVRLRSAGLRGGFGAAALWREGVGGTEDVFLGEAGRTYCFSARALDASGNASAYGAESCTAVPADDRTLLRSKGWSKRASGKAYLGTFLQSTRRGAALTLRKVEAARIAILVTKCPRCGVLDVLWNGKRLKRIRLGAANARWMKLIPVAGFGAMQTGTLRLVVRSASRSVRVDGVGISAA